MIWNLNINFAQLRRTFTFTIKSINKQRILSKFLYRFPDEFSHLIVWQILLSCVHTNLNCQTKGSSLNENKEVGQQWWLNLFLRKYSLPTQFRLKHKDLIEHKGVERKKQILYENDIFWEEGKLKTLVRYLLSKHRLLIQLNLNSICNP